MGQVAAMDPDQIYTGHGCAPAIVDAVPGKGQVAGGLYRASVFPKNFSALSITGLSACYSRNSNEMLRFRCALCFIAS
jgi:hypothetical protein